MVKYRADLSEVFGALADGTRRDIVTRLTRGEATAGEVASGFSLSQPAISRHVKVLERCGIVKRKVVGREHYLRLAPRAMSRASEWLEAQRRFWDETFDSLDDYLARPHDIDKENTK